MADRTDGDLDTAGGHRPMPPSRKPYCTHCKEGITPDKRLFSCAECHRYYHPACYGRTLPGQPIDSPSWTCRRCLEKKSRRSSGNRMGTTVSHYHESKSLYSYSNTAKSAKTMTPAVSPSQRQLSDMASGLGSSATRDGWVAKCAYQRCSSKAELDGVFCSAHSSEKSHGASHETTNARLLPEHGANGVLPMTRRKTGTTGLPHSPHGHSAAASKSKANGSYAQKPAREPPSPSETAGPARKKPRLDDGSATEPPVNNGTVTKKPPWATTFNQKAAIKTAGDGSAKSAETGGKSRLATDKTPRKFAPKTQLAFKVPALSRAGSEKEDRSVSASPAPGTNGNAPRATSISTATPHSSGRQFVGNESINQWFQRRDSSKPESNLGDKKDSFMRTSSIDRPVSVGTTPPITAVSQRETDANSLVLPPSLIASSPKPSASGIVQRHVSLSPFKPSAASTPISKPPPISKQHLEGWHFVPPPPRPNKAMTVSNVDFDSLIYGQEGAAPPPMGVTVDPQKVPSTRPPPQNPEPPDGPFYAHIDPRIHWPQVHSAEWYEKKMQEITARGGRKANFGKATQRMREQRLRSEPVSWEDSLPEKIRQNPAWVSALKALRQQQEKPAPPDTPAPPETPKKRGKPGPKPKMKGGAVDWRKTARKSTGSFAQRRA